MADKCNKQGCDKSSKKMKKCAACDKLFHNACGEFASYKDKAKPNETVHLCCACNAVAANSASLTLRYNSRSNSTSSQSSKRKALDMDDSDSSEDDEPDLKTILKAVKEGAVSTNKLVTDLNTTVQNFNTNLNMRCDGMDARIGTLESELLELKKSHAAEMDMLRDKCDELDFKTKSDIFIHGHANAGAEDLDLTAAVIHLAEHLDVTITERDIQKIRVIKRRDNPQPRTYAATVQERPPIIAVDFFTHDMALRVVEAKKSYGKLTNRELLETDNNNPISVSFPLNKDQYALLRATKARAVLHNVKYVWNSRGFVFIRQTDGSKAIKVKNASHLDLLLPPANATPPRPTQMDTASPQ